MKERNSFNHFKLKNFSQDQYELGGSKELFFKKEKEVF